jgi:hydrogenase maturation protein HypF
MAKKPISNAGKVGNRAGLSIKVRGIVQGVGFRPFVFTLAEEFGLAGWVVNTSAGVEIEVDGETAALDGFLRRLRSEPPPLARIDEIISISRAPNGYTQFEIRDSRASAEDFQPVPPDIAICSACLTELFDPSNRRFRYPFINCTNCGPRFSIIRDIPYDRPQTTMASFTLCPQCANEYHDPRDRRFHAQPIACPACGPRVWLQAGADRLAENENAISLARRMLSEGKILGLKGLGGFHLACDAANDTAVQELRRRKKRSDKPFALMAFDHAGVENHCFCDSRQADLLNSRQAPIVLLERRADTPVSPQVAPGQNSIGVMLAYTPLHLLLLEPAPDFPDLLVMTSGNLSEEPIAYQDDDAISRLAPLCDAFLLHDRPIHIRVDDSVAAVVNEKRYFVRRSRGEAPDPLLLPFTVPPLLAAGAELKNTFCLTRDRYAFLSHHIGDLENFETFRSYEEGINHFETLFRLRPAALACDLHPNYLATRYAEERAQRENLPLIKIQHHHAHLAACLADNGWNNPEPVIGLCFDGTGLGTDGAIWGGEVLIGGYSGFERAYHLAYCPLPGGDAAVRKPARAALAYLRSAQIDWDPSLPPVAALCAEERTVIGAQIDKRINAPLSSSLGRLFDAVSSLLGVRHIATYEGQAAIELEAIAAPAEAGRYAFAIQASVFDPAPLLAALLADWREGTSLPVLAARFHNSVAHLCLEICQTIRKSQGISTVALSGGVWQNRYLLRRTLDILQAERFTVLIHNRLPPNDGCIALGQALIAAHHQTI